MGSSLEPVMVLIKDFGDWSGLRIYWEKSVLLPLDPLTDALPIDAAQLQIVSEFQYLGVKVNACPQDYINLNVSLFWPELQIKLIYGVAYH